MNDKHSEDLALMARLPKVVEEVVMDALPLIGDPARKGGYFCLSRHIGPMLLVSRIGDIELWDIKAQKYFALCQEKVSRLNLNCCDFSSFQSRDESKRQYGGAIRTTYYILGFSGLPELWDEACMLEVAKREPSIWITPLGYTRILQASQNRFVNESFGGHRG